MAIARTSHGHARSDRVHLDRHYQHARREYEAAIEEVGIAAGWAVLDAGCGAGSFHDAMRRRLGDGGSIVAMDLAPENVESVRSSSLRDPGGGIVSTLVGRVDQIPLADASFDCVWTANVLQYLTETAFQETVGEFKRVLKRGGTLAIKEADSSMTQVSPIDQSLVARLYDARKRKASAEDRLGPWSGTSIPRRLRHLGLPPLKRRGFLVERWAPLDDVSLEHVGEMLIYLVALAEDLDLPDDDRRRWREIGLSRDAILGDPDLCAREFFVVTVAAV